MSEAALDAPAPAASWFHQATGIDLSASKPDEYWYVVLILVLFLLPQLLSKLRIPTAITALGLGALAGMGMGLFQHDSTVDLLALFGIVSLFLFAGMEVDFRELRQHKRVLAAHVLVCLTALAGVAWAAMAYFAIPAQPALILALGLLTPSTGFILSSLHSFGLDAEASLQVKINAIAGEILALVVLFFCVHSQGLASLATACGALAALAVAIPIVLWVYGRLIARSAPDRDFAIVLIVAILASWATKALGAYYLLGAFITGIVAMRMRKALRPQQEAPKVMHSIELFASFFIPFYFFHAGSTLRAAYFSTEALLWGGIFLLLALPLRVGYLVGHRMPLIGEPLHLSRRIATAMLPTLVFTLVMTGLLCEGYPAVVAAHPYLIGGMIIYTLVNTMIPGLVLARGAAPVDFDHPHAAERYAGNAPPPETKGT